MAGAAVTVAYGLATGFDRAAREADLPDVIVRFDGESRAEIDRIVAALPDVADRAYRLELNGVGLSSEGGSSDQGSVELVDGPRRGYAIVAGRDVGGRRNEAVIERGVADAWHLKVGDEIDVGRLGGLRVAGIAVAPDNVAFPLASAPRIYIARAWIEAAAGAGHQHPGPRRALRDPQRRARAHRLGGGDRHRAARGLLAHRAGRCGDDARGHHGGRRPAAPAGHRGAARDRLLARADRR
jgi:hypothetical protein